MDEKQTVETLVKSEGFSSGVALFAVRRPSSDNEINTYDDKIYVLIDGKVQKTWGWNTDPSVYRTGMARLVAGKIYKYKSGIHGLSKPPERRYPAFVQASPVIVSRVNQGLDTGFFGINLHRGSHNSTSSLGCQTINPDDWDDFHGYVINKLHSLDQEIFPYFLYEADKLVTGLTNQKVEGDTAKRYSYLWQGKEIGEYGIQKNIIAGRAFVPVRAFVSLLTGIPKPQVEFSWQKTADNQDTQLFYNGKEIEVCDVVENTTWGSLGDSVGACGFRASIDNEKKQVTILK